MNATVTVAAPSQHAVADAKAQARMLSALAGRANAARRAGRLTPPPLSLPVRPAVRQATAP